MAVGDFFQIFSLDVVDLHLIVFPASGIVGRQGSGLLEHPVRQLLSLCFYDHMGAWHSLGVEPPVAAVCRLKGQLLVLVVVLSHIDVEAV